MTCPARANHVGMAIILGLGMACGSQSTDSRSDASPALDGNQTVDTPGNFTVTSLKDDAAPATPTDAALAPDISLVQRDSHEGVDGIASRDGGNGDLRIATPDSAARPLDALECTPQQGARQAIVHQKAIIPFADTPKEVQGFLSQFLSKAYIEEHFRFFQFLDGTTVSANILGFDFLDGCDTSTVPGQIQWGVPIYQGKIRYMGPSREWRILIGEEKAKRLMAEAGCDASNLELAWASVSTPIPGVNEYLGLSYHPVWKAGGQSVAATPNLPSGSYCYGPSCTVHAETGSVSQTPGVCSSPL